MPHCNQPNQNLHFPPLSPTLGLTSVHLSTSITNGLTIQQPNIENIINELTRSLINPTNNLHGPSLTIAIQNGEQTDPEDLSMIYLDSNQSVETSFTDNSDDEIFPAEASLMQPAILVEVSFINQNVLETPTAANELVFAQDEYFLLINTTSEVSTASSSLSTQLNQAFIHYDSEDEEEVDFTPSNLLDLFDQAATEVQNSLTEHPLL